MKGFPHTLIRMYWRGNKFSLCKVPTCHSV